jgi:capsular polysaccharide biosynthesis protein
MDLLEFWRVARRHRRIIVVGASITLFLATFALFRPYAWGLEVRSPAIYVARSTLFVTQSGFPWGRSALTEYVRARGAGEDDVAVPRFAEPSRMEYLAYLYSELATSDGVYRIVDRRFPLGTDDEEYLAVPMTTANGASLPLIEVSGTSTSKARAVALANTAASALQRYIASEQRANRVPAETGIVLPVLTRATVDDAEVLKGVKVTTALMIGVLGLIGTLFVAFVVDNLQRQRRLAETLDAPELSVEPVPAAARRAHVSPVSPGNDEGSLTDEGSSATAAAVARYRRD